jgi:hypothetical protein
VRIVVCLADGEKPDRTAGSSIYLAVQNMLPATRARSRHDLDDRLSKTDLIGDRSRRRLQFMAAGNAAGAFAR